MKNLSFCPQVFGCVDSAHCSGLSLSSFLLHQGRLSSSIPVGLDNMTHNMLWTTKNAFFPTI